MCHASACVPNYINRCIITCNLNYVLYKGIGALNFVVVHIKRIYTELKTDENPYFLRRT